MSQNIDKSRIVAGRLIRVSNISKRKFSNSKDDYLSVWVEDANGKNERCLLFTDREIKLAETRSKRNPDNITTKPFLQDLID